MLCELLTKASSLIEVLAYVCNLFLSGPHVALTPRSQPIKNLFNPQWSFFQEAIRSLSQHATGERRGMYYSS